MKVRDPNGITWRVRRRWMPWKRRMELDDPTSVVTLPDGDDPIGCFFGAIGLLLAIPALVILVLVAAEALLLLVLLPFVVAGRVLLGRHWPVEVRLGLRRVSETDGGDWAASRELIAAEADLLRAGEHSAQSGEVYAHLVAQRRFRL